MGAKAFFKKVALETGFHTLLFARGAINVALHVAGTFLFFCGLWAILDSAIPNWWGWMLLGPAMNYALRSIYDAGILVMAEKCGKQIELMT